MCYLASSYLLVCYLASKNLFSVTQDTIQSDNNKLIPKLVPTGLTECNSYYIRRFSVVNFCMVKVPHYLNLGFEENTHNLTFFSH